MILSLCKLVLQNFRIVEFFQVSKILELIIKGDGIDVLFASISQFVGMGKNEPESSKA